MTERRWAFSDPWTLREFALYMVIVAVVATVRGRGIDVVGAYAGTALWLIIWSLILDLWRWTAARWMAQR